MDYMNVQKFNINFNINENILNKRNQYYSRDIFMCEKPEDQGLGYLNLSIISGLSRTPIPQVYVTIYARKGSDEEIYVMGLLSTINPILVQLPVAYSTETLVTGPEYDFSYYNIEAASQGYYPTKIYNIRMFHGIRTDFDINMIPVAVANPEYRQIIELPPHERDILNKNQR